MAQYQPLPKLLEQLAEIDPVLEMAGTHQWSPAMIETYKARELAKAPPAHKWWNYRKTLRSATIIGTVFGSMAVAGGLSFIATEPETVRYAGWNSESLILICMAVMVGIMLPLMKWADRVKLRGPAKWSTLSPGRYIHKYGWLPPPAFQILARAQEQNPDIPCRVHILVQDTFLLDPILEIDGRYVLVWDKDGTIILPHA